MTMEATTAIVAKKSVCQPCAAARKLNAAPLLNTSTRLKKSVTFTLSPGANDDSTAIFVSRSAMTTAAARANQCQDLCTVLRMATRLARALEVAFAARAESLGAD